MSSFNQLVDIFSPALGHSLYLLMKSESPFVILGVRVILCKSVTRLYASTAFSNLWALTHFKYYLYHPSKCS